MPWSKTIQPNMRKSNQFQARIGMDVRISKQGDWSSYNCIPYVQKLIKYMKDIKKRSQIKLLKMKTTNEKYTGWG